MSFCHQCGMELTGSTRSCPTCGTAQVASTADTIRTLALKSDDANGSRAGATPDNPHKQTALLVAGGTVVAWLVLQTLGHYHVSTPFWLALSWVFFLLVLVPLAFGSVIVLKYGDHTPAWLAGVGTWLDRRAAASSESPGRFNRFVLRPSLGAYERLNAHAHSVGDDVVRNGARAAVYLFVPLLFLVLLYVLTAIVLLIAVVMLVVFFIDAYEGNGPSSTSVTKHPSGTSRSSTTYSGSNWVNEQKTGRVDDEGNIYEGTHFLNEKKVGRVDADGTRFEGTNFLNEHKVGRTDEHGNIYTGTNFLNEQKVGRVDEEGNVFEGTNFLNERKVGRIDKDES